jgi:hypothetical protein
MNLHVTDEYGKYSNYLLEWQREVEKYEYPLHVMFYEDLKMVK